VRAALTKGSRATLREKTVTFRPSKNGIVRSDVLVKALLSFVHIRLTNLPFD
jgi:hypothetical protein